MLLDCCVLYTVKYQFQTACLKCSDSSDVTIIESKSKIVILARNRIGSKSQFPCTTETILSVVAFAHSRCRAVMKYRPHQCSAGARTCLSSAGELWVTAAGLKCDCGRGAGV